MICGSGGSKSRREAHFQVKMYKTHHCRTTFGSCDVEKVHAVVARSTFRSQNVKSTRGSDHFWKLRCRKSVRRCGAKMREAHFEVKFLKTPGVSEHFWRFRCRFASLHYITLHYTTLHNTTTTTTQLYNYTTTQLHSTTLQLHNYTPLH